ncbi:MAG: protein kinase [Deltaproteobacteria bacterium]|nr:protein kinase [Deltaproteobacteria bacterium]
MTSNPKVPSTAARRFSLGERTIEGTSGVLLFGRDPDTGTPVVVKLFRPTAFATAPERQKAVRELVKQVGLRHPSLPRIVATGDEEGVLWVARDWIEGRSLNELIAEGPLQESDATRIASQIASALMELHRVMLVHRDIRPGHVILGIDGIARLIDTSGSRVTTLQDGRAVMGTVGWMSPEAASGKLVNARSDLYSLGALLLTMLSGANPFGVGSDTEILHRQTTIDPVCPSAVSDACATLVLSALAREPRERPFNAQQFERNLGAFFVSEREALDDEGPPTAAIDEGMISKALAITAGPSIVDDEFDDAEQTEVGKPALAAAPMSPPPRAQLSSPAIPAPPPNTASHRMPPVGGNAALESRPVSIPPPSGSGLRKATLVGMAPLHPKAPAPSTASSKREDSGSRASTDFEREENTLIQEDSRIFGTAGTRSASVHGTAVPPLPPGLATDVLHRGGNVDAPIAAHSAPALQIPTPFSHIGTASAHVAAPTPDYETEEEEGSPTISAHFGALRASAEEPSAITEDSASWDEAAAMGQPNAPYVAAPMQAAPPVGQQYSEYQPARPPYPGMPAQGQPMAQAHGEMQPAYPAPGMAPPMQGQGGYGQSPTGYAPQPGVYPTGAYPQMQGTGMYPQQNPAMSAAWQAMPPKAAPLWPWILAGCMIAAVAGGTGYAMAMRGRGAATTLNAEMPPTLPTVASPSTVGTLPPTPTTPVAPQQVVIPAPTATPTVVVPTVVPTPPEPPQPAPVPVALPATPQPAQPTPQPEPPAVRPTPVAPAQTRVVSTAHPPVIAPPPRPVPQTPVQQARALMARGDNAGAKSLLESWVASHPRDAEAQYQLGEARFVLGQRRPAGDSYRLAISAGNYARRYWQRLVDRQISIGDRQGAINTLQDVLRHRAGDRDAQRQLNSLQGNSAPVPAFGRPAGR